MISMAEFRGMRPAVAFWSGGKDSALALDRVRRSGQYEVCALITTVNAEFRRVSMHGVREELIDLQSEAIGISAHKMYVGGRGGNDDYVAALRAALQTFKNRGITNVIFGDIFLQDLRQWRESLLADLAMTGVFPLWQENTRTLVQEFFDRRFKAIICCTNDAQLKQSDVGRPLDADFVRDLPAGVDPCGENGEYHSFVHDGPIFQRPVAFEIGEVVYRPLLPEIATHNPLSTAPASAQNIPVPAASGPTTTKGFWFVDLLPGVPTPVAT
jgi:uncharacterized protein (TIGR00290 family)